jgi:hypothetical protein
LADNLPRIAIYGKGQFVQMLTWLAVERGWHLIAARPGIDTLSEMGPVRHWPRQRIGAPA